MSWGLFLSRRGSGFCWSSVWWLFSVLYFFCHGWSPLINHQGQCFIPSWEEGITIQRMVSFLKRLLWLMSVLWKGYEIFYIARQQYFWWSCVFSALEILLRQKLFGPGPFSSALLWRVRSSGWFWGTGIPGPFFMLRLFPWEFILFLTNKRFIILCLEQAIWFSFPL